MRNFARLAAAALGSALLACCGTGTVAVDATGDPVVDDVPSPDLTRFLRDWCCGRGSEFGPGPGTVAAALERSTVVVLAGVGDVRPGYVHRRTCVRTGACGDISHAGAYVELTSVQVLSGSLPSGATDLLVGKGVGVGADDPDGTKALRAQLPKGGQAVWFLDGPLGDPPPAPPPTDPANPPAAPAGRLRPGQVVAADPPRIREPAWIAYERTAHVVVDNRTTFVQGPDGVLAPMAMEEDRRYFPEDGVLGLAARYATLSDLVAAIRDTGTR
jgi:hypothetical protein